MFDESILEAVSWFGAFGGKFKMVGNGKWVLEKKTQKNKTNLGCRCMVGS